MRLYDTNEANVNNRKGNLFILLKNKVEKKTAKANEFDACAEKNPYSPPQLDFNNLILFDMSSL